MFLSNHQSDKVSKIAVMICSISTTEVTKISVCNGRFKSHARVPAVNKYESQIYI